MRLPITTLAALCLATGAALAAPRSLGTDTPLLAASANDQVPATLVRLPAPARPLEHAAVQFSWALDPAATLTPPAAFVADSREFWRTTDAASLHAGLPLRLSAAGALIRISPARGSASVDATAVRVLDGAGRSLAASRMDAAAVQAQGMPVSDGAAVLRVTDATARDVRVQLATARGQYVVHVYEPASPLHLQAALARDHALAGGQLRLHAAMLHDGRALAAARAGGLLVSPSGRSWPLQVTIGRDGQLRADIRLPRDADTAPGLWEVQLFADADGIARDARTAFALAQPTARFSGQYRFDTRTVQVQLPVQIGAPGRYEARGVLYATGPDRALHPVAAAQAANWFEPGTGRLLLDFGRHNVPLGYGAPFEVRDLQLHDQGRMAPLEVREQALRIGR